MPAHYAALEFRLLLLSTTICDSRDPGGGVRCIAEAVMLHEFDHAIGLGHEHQNPKIVADLAAGEYLIQIRHFNSTGGTGKYGIRVTK